MPTISMFYGILVYMYFSDTGKHNMPHIHAKYQGEEVVISIPEGEVLEGSFSRSKLKLLLAWVELHRDELMANWELAVTEQPVYPIDPLR